MRSRGASDCGVTMTVTRELFESACDISVGEEAED